MSKDELHQNFPEANRVLVSLPSKAVRPSTEQQQRPLQQISSGSMTSTNPSEYVGGAS